MILSRGPYCLSMMACRVIACCTMAAAATIGAERADIVRQLQEARSQYRTRGDWLSRQQEIRHKFLQGAKLWPLPIRTPLNPIIGSRREYDGYSVENVAIETFPGFYCTGNLYRPLTRTVRGPGILCPHGHFPGGRTHADVQIRSAQLARMGATVFAYSMVGWQDAQQASHDDPLVLTLQTWNSIRALDWLCELPEVEPRRIGMTGASGGGTQTFFLSAIDERVRASAPAVIVYPWTPPGCCLCEGKGTTIMEASGTNAIELSACVAPRAQLYLSVGGDETHDFPTVGMPFLENIYELWDARSQVENVHFAQEAHDYGPSKRAALYPFFARHLGLRLQDEDRTRIVIEPEEILRTFSEKEPLPAHALRGTETIASAFARLPREPISPPATLSGVAPEGEELFFTPVGFHQPGSPRNAVGPSTNELSIVVRDKQTGNPTPCRISVVGSDGHYYQPASNHLTPYSMTGQWPLPGAWGNRTDKAPYRYLGRYFYSTGQTSLSVPVGDVRVEVAKGYEFRPQQVTVPVSANRAPVVEIELDRCAPMAEHGYFSGDTHLHFPRIREWDDQAIFDLLEAEDVWYGTPLGYNDPAGPYTGAMDTMASPQMCGVGTRSIRTRRHVSIVSGQEYRSGNFGHLLLYLRPHLVFSGQQTDADDGPAFGVVGQETRAGGGIAIHAHGGYAQEIYADVALRSVDAVELLQFGIYRPIGLVDWYHMLNSGYRFPCVGASDFPACRYLCDCRTYTWTERPANDRQTQPDIAGWLRGAANGQSFVTTGPLIVLEVDGHRPGQIIQHTGAGPHKVNVQARVRCEVTPITELDLIVNGTVVERFGYPRGDSVGRWLEVERSLELNESSWIALRAHSTTLGGQPDAEAHTNPIYVYVDGRAPYRQQSLDTWVSRIDEQIRIQAKRDFRDKAAVLAYYQRARDLLITIRQRGGLRADEDPLALLSATATTDSGAIPLSDLSRPDLSAAELQEFLRPVPATSAQAAAFDVADGFRMELVAAEPLVVDPVAATFDEDGNLYVCEMRDYPFKPPAGSQPLGTVRLLRDLDGDGRFDKSTVFAEQMLWAAGVAPWRGGVFVAAPPDIWYLKDTDGDDRSDVRRQIFTGFGTDNQQAMLNNLQWGLDHKIYGATAGNGGLVRSTRQIEQQDPVSVNGRDFRFDPITERLEPITGTVQFGNTFDDVGNRFVCSESQPLQHVVLPDHYLARNPHLATGSGIHNIAPGPVSIFRISPVERWREIRSGRRIAKKERAATSAGASHHVIDAAAGVTVYRGGAYPEKYHGNIFVADGQNNLIHRRELIPSGVTFQSRRLDNQTEFVRSADIWFRPVNFVNAPDGTLYCLDMSREVLESIHIPLDVAKHLDFTSGRNSGRIYRIAPPEFQSPAPPQLSRATSAELVQDLESPHGWWRDTAHRLIWERQDISIVPDLRQLARNGKRSAARIHALWSLAGLEQLDEETILHALSDGDAPVREHAVRLSETRLGSSHRVLNRVTALAGDEIMRVRFQVAFSCGEAGDSPEVTASLAEIATRDGNDPWMRAAILSSANHGADRLFATLLPTQSPLLGPLLRTVGARHQSADIARVLRSLAELNRQDDEPAAKESINERIDVYLLELATGLRQSGGMLPFDSEDASAQLVQLRVARACAVAADVHAEAAARVRAIELASCAPTKQVTELLVRLLDIDSSETIQSAAIRGLSRQADADLPQTLLSKWNSLYPASRQEALKVLLARDPFTLELLESAARDGTSVSDIDPVQRERLLAHADERIRILAVRLLGATSPERKAVVDDYRANLTPAANVTAGEQVFVTHCAACHQLAGKGHPVGPDLTSSAQRDPEALLMHILDPHQYVLPNFVQYVVTDQQGRIFTGILTAQSTTSITLKKEQNETITLLRSEIEELTRTEKSLMPEGLERSIDTRAMSDLIAFLQAAGVGQNSDPYRERDFGTLPGLIEP